MPAPLQQGSTFKLKVGGKTANFKVNTVSGNDFTAELQEDVAGAFGADLKSGLVATYKDADQTVALTGKALYQRLEMAFGATYAVGRGDNFATQLSGASLKDGNQPTLTIGINRLFGDTGSMLKDANVSGTYNSDTKAYNFSGNIQLDFTPEDSTNNDDINVSLSNLSFKKQTIDGVDKGFLQSAKLSFSQAGGNAINLGGVSIVPTSLSIDYNDNRLTPTNNRHTKAFTVSLDGTATWGAETTSKDDDFALGLSGSGTYAQNYTTVSIKDKPTTSNASVAAPVRINAGLTDFSATATGSGSIDLGPLTLLPKQAGISFAADLDANYSLWNIGGKLGLQAGFLPDVELNLGQGTSTARDTLNTILNSNVSTYPTAGGWSLGGASANLVGSNSKPLVDLGLVSVDGLNLSLSNTGKTDGADLTGLGFYKFNNNNQVQPKTAPAVLTQDQGKNITLSLNGVKLNSSALVNTLKGTTATVSQVLSPVRPLVDFFTQKVTIFDGVDQALREPIISFLESTPNNKYADGTVQAVEFVDSALSTKALLAGKTSTSITPAVKAAENVFTVLDAVSNLAEESSNGSINLGSFSFSYPLNKLKPQPAAAAPAKGAVTASVPQPPATVPPRLADFQKGGRIATQIASTTPNPSAQTAGQKPLFTSNSSISFPVLSDPIGYISKYFTDGSADLFKADIDFGFAQTFDVSVRIPAFPVVKVGIQGGVDASVKTSIAASLDAAAMARLKDGFSVSKLGEEILSGTGIDLEQTKAQFGANLALSLGVDAYIASLNLVGGLEGRLSVQPVLMKKEGEKAESQILKLGSSGLSISKPDYIQPGVKLKHLKLEIDQNLDNIIATGLDIQSAYSRNTWLLTIILNPIQNASEASQFKTITDKLGGYFLDRLRLIELNDNVIRASAASGSTNYRKLNIEFAKLSDETSEIYKASLAALKEQLKLDLPSRVFDSLDDTDFKQLMRLVCNSSPQSIEYATIDASDKTANSVYAQRKEFLQKNRAFEVIDGTADKTNTPASKQAITYYRANNQASNTNNFFMPSTAALNSSNKANDPELVIKVNGKLNQPFNSVSLDLLPTDVPAETTVTIRAQDASNNWQSIGLLKRTARSGNAQAQLSLESAIDEKAAELILLAPKDSDQANWKLVLNLSNQNKGNSDSIAQSIINKASQGTLQLAFDVSSGSSQALGISEPRIVQGGAVSVGLETGATTSKLITNALGQFDDNGKLTSDQLREFAIVGQPTDILNPAEWFYSRNVFGGIPETVVELSNFGLNFQKSGQAMNRYDSLAIVNAVNRVAINDSLSEDVSVKVGTSTRQTVDPVTGDTYLSYIDATSGNFAIGRRAANSTVFQLIKIFEASQSALFASQSEGPDIVAYNGNIMGAAKAAASGKLARFLITNNQDLKSPIYTLNQIDTSVTLKGTPKGPIRIGLIAERDANSNRSSSNELTVAIAYTNNNNNSSTVLSNTNLRSSNIDQSSQAINLDLANNFSNWSPSDYTHGGNPVDIDFMEFSNNADLRSHLSLGKGSTFFSLEGSKNNVKVWMTSASPQRRYQYPLNIPEIDPSTISVVYSKQAGAKESVPAFINNWKGTPSNADNNTDWKSDGSLSKDLAIVVTGSTTGDPQNSRKNGLANDTDYSGLSYNEIKELHEGGSNDVVYLYSPYNDMLTANAANLRLSTYATSSSSVAQQNTNNAAGGLGWIWYPMPGKSDNSNSFWDTLPGKSKKSNSNVQTNKNANLDNYLALGASSLIALDTAQPGSMITDLRNSATNNFLQLSKNTFQIIPRSDGNYALSAISNQGKMVSVDQIPNYETGLLTTKTTFNAPATPAKLIKGYFDGTLPFVNQGEWAPLGIVSAADGVYLGDLRNPVKYNRPEDIYAAPIEFKNARDSIDVGQSRYIYTSDPSIILEPGRQLSSANGKYTLDMQLNGELILYENTTKGRVILYNINDFIYDSDRKNIVAGYGRGVPDKRAVAGTKLGIKQAPVTKSGSNPSGVYLCLIVPTQDKGSDYRYIPLNPDKSSADNINYIFPQKDGGSRELNRDWRERKSEWGVTVADTDNNNDQFGRLVLENNGNLVAYDQDSSDPEVLFYLKNWKAAESTADVTSLTNSTPFGFNGLISDVIKEDNTNISNASIKTEVWNDLLAGRTSIPDKYQVVNISPDLNSKSTYIPGNKIRDVVITGSGNFTAMLAKRDGIFPRLSDAITWGRSAPPANQIKSIRFLSPVNDSSDSLTIETFIESIWKNAKDNPKSGDFELLNAAVPVADYANYNEWLAKFQSTYASLRALSVLPAVSSRSYFSVPTIELTPRSADLSQIYKSFSVALSKDKPYISIETNFKLDAFVKVVASFAWWSWELMKATFPLLDQTWSFKTGYGAGGPIYGTQKIHLDQDHDLIADSAEISTTNADAAFSLDLSPLANALQLAPNSPQNTIWNGKAYVYAPPSEGIDFRAGLLVVQPSAHDSVFDTATGLANNKVYISVPNSEYLVANIWTSVKYSPVLDYHFFSTDATGAAKADFYAQTKLRYSTDPYFVTKLTPSALEDCLYRRLAGVPAAYSTSAGDTFDAYNGLVAADRTVADQAFSAFRFTSRLTLVLETVERLLNSLKLDSSRWGQNDSFGDRRSLISSYQLIPTLAMAADGVLDPHYSQVLRLAASGQPSIIKALDAGTFKLDLSRQEHVQMLLTFAALTIPNALGQPNSPFATNGRLNLSQPNLPGWLKALRLDAIASSLTSLNSAYDSLAQRLYKADPRLLTATLAPVKRDALKPDGLIDAMLQSSLPSSASKGFTSVLNGLLQNNLNHSPEVQDDTRIASITEAIEFDVDSKGVPLQHKALRVSLNHAAPPGGTIIPLAYSGSAKYGQEYSFEDNSVQPKYAFVPFGETSVVIPVKVLPQKISKDWSLTIGIENPSSSYHTSADINKVFLNYKSDKKQLKLYDNNVLVRLSDDPDEPHKLVSASPEDRGFDYNFYRNSRVVGVEAEGPTARSLQYYVSSENPKISIYTTAKPSIRPSKTASWILVNDDVMKVFEGDAGPVDIVQYFNPKTGIYGYASTIDVDHPYQGAGWQNKGIVFSLRDFNRDISEALGTITPVTSVGTSLSAVPERSTLLTKTREQIKVLGYASDQINRNTLRLRPQIATYEQGRTSVVLDLASMADHLWRPMLGLPGRSASTFAINRDGSIRDASYNASTGAGSRVYSLHSKSESIDTVVIEVVDGVNDGDVEINKVDVNTATALAATFNPLLKPIDGSLQLLDTTQVSAPLMGVVTVSVKARTGSVQDLRYTLLDKNETLSDLSNLSTAALQSRSRALLSTLMKTSLTALTSEKGGTEASFSQSISLTNGQKLVLLERSGRTEGEPYRVVAMPSGPGAQAQSITTPAGVSLLLDASARVNRLPDFLGRDQNEAPVLNFTGLDGKGVGFNVEIARNTDLKSSLGFYRVLDNRGSVRDRISGAVISPGQPGYAKAALDQANLPSLRSFSIDNNGSATFADLNVKEAALLAPYGKLPDGSNLFPFAAANRDGRSHFRVLGQNIFGFEEESGRSSAFDFDDLVLAVRTPTLIS